MEDNTTDDVFTVWKKTLYFNPHQPMTPEEANALFSRLISNGNAVVIGQLQTPIESNIPEEELTAYRALTTYTGTTVVSTDNPVAGMEVGYVMDGNKYRESVDKRLDALLAAQTGI